MVRVLVMIAVTGFFVSLVTLSTAVAIGGPQILEDAAWNGWRGHWTHSGGYEGWGWERDESHGSGGDTTRELTWAGGDSLAVDVPADVQYTQGPVAKITVSGPARAVENVEIDGGHVRWVHGHHRHWGDLTIVMTAPAVTHFQISGSGRLAIANYKQDRLDVGISGSGDVTASGETNDVSLEVSGNGDADLAGLKAKTARVDISGSGEAKIAPTDAANVEISGSGEVSLLTHPPKLETSISGSGSLHQ